MPKLQYKHGVWIGLIVLILAVNSAAYFILPELHFLNWLLLPLLVLALYDTLQKRHTILRIYPVIGHFRYLFESVRPEIHD